MKNLNRLFALVLVCLAVMEGVEHFRTSRAIAAAEAAAKQPHRLGAAVNPSVPPMLHALSHLSTGSDPISDATTSVDGLMSAADKTTFNQRTQDGLHTISDRQDDFRSGTTAGQLNWRVTNPATGNTIIQTATNQDSTHLGIIRMPTGNTSSTQATMVTFASGPVLDFAPDATAQDNKIECKIRFETLSTSSQEYKWTCGYVSSAVAAPTDKIAVEYDRASGGDTHFRLTTCASSTCTSASGTTVISANTWYRVSAMHAAGSSSWALNVNGSQEATKSDNVPTAQMGLMVGLFKSVGTTDLNTYLDYVQERIVWASGR